MQKKQSFGFTLIELSIVLVIIGLIVGGILVGRDMIRASELRSLMTDIERYQTALNTFRLKYNCLPGDCLTATQFFGTDSSGCPSGGGATGTCNGDGNKLFGGAGNMAEGLRAWQQMGLAGMIEGSYSGVGGNAIPGTNVPIARFQKAGFVFYPCVVAACWWQNSMRMGLQYSNALESGFLTGFEAQHVDSKIDDGIAATGRFFGADGHGVLGQTNCVDGSNVYITTGSDRHCGLIWWLR